MDKWINDISQCRLPDELYLLSDIENLSSKPIRADKKKLKQKTQNRK